MKRAAFGFVWFLGLYLGLSFGLGVVMGFQSAVEGKTLDETYEAAYESGNSLGVPIFLLSAGAALYGTANKKLPGTK